jgi:hypothetical protein
MLSLKLCLCILLDQLAAEAGGKSLSKNSDSCGKEGKLPLSQASQAYGGKKSSHKRGKIV